MTHEDFVPLYLSIVRKFARSYSDTELTKSAERVWTRHEKTFKDLNEKQTRRILEAAGLTTSVRLEISR